MAEEEAPAQAGRGIKDLLTKKLGPLPVGIWLLLAGGVFWYVSRSKGSGSAGATTDPAGNTGTIDPATGYVSGSPQDQAALAGGSSGGGATSSGGGQSGSTVGGQYQDNAAWSRAAINYLVGVGVDPTAANEAIQAFLSGQVLTTPQQGEVNLAVQALGAPPTPPSPSGSQPPPVVQPPGGVTYAANPPGNLTVASKTDTSVTLTWSRAANASGYQVRYGTDSNASQGSVSTGADAPSATVGGLTAGTMYFFQVQAQPAKAGAPYATTSAATVAGAPSANTPPPQPGPPVAAPPTAAPQYVTVARFTTPNPPWNSTLSGIAQHYGTTVSHLMSLNPQITNPNVIITGARVRVS